MSAPEVSVKIEPESDNEDNVATSTNLTEKVVKCEPLEIEVTPDVMPDVNYDPLSTFPESGNQEPTPETKKEEQAKTWGIEITTPKLYPCCICKKNFEFLAQLRIHRRLEHENLFHEEKTVSCPDCDKKFRRNCELNKHRRVHTRERRFACDLCDKKYIRKEEMQLHRQLHSGEKPFSCDECDKSFAVKQYLTRHKLTHKQENYPCDECGKVFTVKKYLNVHKRTHLGEKPFACDICDKQFTLKVNLNNHKNIHTGDRPFYCEVCKKQFAQLSCLITHKKIHTGEKPYACDLCGKQFSLKWLLGRHKDVHAQITYTCDVCSKTFTQKRSLAVHQKTRCAKWGPKDDEAADNLSLSPYSNDAGNIQFTNEDIQDGCDSDPIIEQFQESAIEFNDASVISADSSISEQFPKTG